ncbi:MAG TPA: hypothetical protein VJR58_03480, partial [Vineibacter sp.]|nr:hypothetical protein [Vineibacter sp.]
MTVARPAGGIRRAPTLRLAFAALALLSLPTPDAMAHVRTPDFSRLDRNLDGVLPERDGRSRFELRGETKDAPAASGRVCNFSRDTSRSPS